VLSPKRGGVVAALHVTLRGAAARASGLVALVLEDCKALTQHARLEVVRANAGTLRELRCVGHDHEDHLSAADVEALAQAAPQLQLFAVDLSASMEDVTRLLRNNAPFQALRVRDLLVTEVDADNVDAGNMDAEDAHYKRVLALAGAMSMHASLEYICLNGISLNSPAVLGAVCAAALACRLRTLNLERCDLSPASVPAFARLIRDGSLTAIFIDNYDKQLLDEPGAVQLADAIATNRQLVVMWLRGTDLWRDAAASAAVLHALTGHSSLRDVNVGGNEPEDHAAAAGAALGALVAATSAIVAPLVCGLL
jgi:hypothetical protein